MIFKPGTETVTKKPVPFRQIEHIKYLEREPKPELKNFEEKNQIRNL